MARIFTIAFIFLASMSACVNPLKLLEADKPERAYKVSKRQIDRRLGNHKPLRDNELLALRESYRWLQDLQISRIETIEREAKADRWLALYPIYTDLLQRRQDIDSYLQFIPQLKLSYDTATLAALTERSRLEAGKYCYEQALVLSPIAREGDKIKAREAYHWLGRSVEYVPEEYIYQELREEMYELGTVRIAAFVDETSTWDYPVLSDHAVPPSADVFRKGWLEIYTIATDKRIDYDLKIKLKIVRLGQDIEHSSTTSYRKKIQDGFKTVEREVTVGDSTYIVKKKVPVFITVYGEITEVEQSKTALVDYSMQLISINGRLAGNRWDLRRTANWSNDFTVCSGDSRALPTCCFGSYSSFPSNRYMVRKLGCSVHACLLAELCRYFPESKSPKKRRRQRLAKHSF